MDPSDCRLQEHRPVLLARKARRMRKETGDSQYYSPLEADKQPFGHRVKKVLGTPFEMLAKEPILQALTVYMSVCEVSCVLSDCFVLIRVPQFVYGCVYLLFEAYPIGV